MLRETQIKRRKKDMLKQTKGSFSFSGISKDKEKEKESKRYTEY